MNTATMGNNISKALNFERIANLPKEIFQAQSEINSKLLKLNMLSAVKNAENEISIKGLDLYA